MIVGSGCFHFGELNKIDGHRKDTHGASSRRIHMGNANEIKMAKKTLAKTKPSAGRGGKGKRRKGR